MQSLVPGEQLEEAGGTTKMLRLKMMKMLHRFLRFGVERPTGRAVLQVLDSLNSSEVQEIYTSTPSGEAERPWSAGVVQNPKR